MKSKLILALTGSLLFEVSSSAAFTLPFWREPFFELCPFIGADYRWFWTSGTGPLRYLIPESFPGGNVYIGGKFTENFGLELGYSRTSRRHKTKLTKPFNTHTSTRLTSYYLDANFYFPIVFCSEIFLGPGIESMKIRSRVDGPFLGQTNIYNTQGHVWRFGIGTQYHFSNSFGVRAVARWESTELLKLNGVKLLKASLSGAIGLRYQF